MCKKTHKKKGNKLIVAFMLFYSSSIGIADTIAPHDTLTQIDSIITSAKKSVMQTIAQARSGDLKREPGSTMLETFEQKVNAYLNKATGKAGKTVKESLHKLNNIKQMVDAGSKGNAINISQIIACVGQQNVNGKRIPYGFRRRTLPHFNRDDLQPESRGLWLLFIFFLFYFFCFFLFFFYSFGFFFEFECAF